MMKISSPIMPRTKPDISVAKSTFSSFIASISPKRILLIPAIAEAGPTGPFVIAFWWQTMPNVFIKPPAIPIQKRYELKASVVQKIIAAIKMIKLTNLRYLNLR